VDVAIERLWIVLNLTDPESSASVDAGHRIQDTGLEWTLETALATALITLASLLGVGECETWWTARTLGCLVDV